MPPGIVLDPGGHFLCGSTMLPMPILAPCKRLTILLLLPLAVTACGQDGCAEPRQQMKDLAGQLIDAANRGDIAGGVIIQAKMQELQEGEYWVCFPRDTPHRS